MGPKWDELALVVLMVSGITDYLDGKLARSLNQTSKIGAILDPVADRFFILAVVIGLGYRDIIPWWLAVILPLRDVFLFSLVPFLRTRGYSSLPVHFLGKAATASLLYAFPLLLLGDADGHGRRPRQRVRLGLHGLGCGALLVGRHPLRIPGPTAHGHDDRAVQRS